MTLPVAAFFEKASTPGRAIVFTTFSLDEQVLVELLREHGVRADQRIVVFHDVMKHHAPGFLRQHYADSLVASVQIVQTRGPANSCPVFHSKLWLAVEKRPFLCRVLAVPSLNLRRFHLDDAYRTFDTFPWWSELALRLDELGWMNRELLFDRRGHMRCKLPCATVLVDARNGKPTHIPVERLTLPVLLKQLYSNGELSMQQYDRASKHLHARNLAIHGYEVEGPDMVFATATNTQICLGCFDDARTSHRIHLFSSATLGKTENVWTTRFSPYLNQRGLSTLLIGTEFHSLKRCRNCAGKSK